MSNYEEIELHRKERLDLLSNMLKNFTSEAFHGTRKGEITLEIGCGHGHFLSDYAENFAQEICVGIDVVNKRLVRCNRKKNARGIKNLYFFRGEATEFLLSIPENIIIRRLFLLFLDPWPKNRHIKNRLLQVEFLDLLLKVAHNNLEIFFRTDSLNYFIWTKQQVAKTLDWKVILEFKWPFERATVFQEMCSKYYSMKIVRKYIE